MKKNRKIAFVILIITVLTIAIVSWFGFRIFLFEKDISISKNLTSKLTNDIFRNSTLRFIREITGNYFNNQPFEIPQELKIEGNWHLFINIYHQGEIKGRGEGKRETLPLALEEATLNAIKKNKNLDKENIKEARFLVSFYSPNKQPFSFIEYNKEGKELIGDLVVVRGLDKKLIREKIEQGKEYLLRMIDSEKKGAHKYYYTLTDSFENRLHTIYTSSLLYTLLKIYRLDKDEELLNQIYDSSEFILLMQNKKEGSKTYGGFYYSYYLGNNEKEKKFPVGTTSKTIFTLLELYKLSNNLKYLKAAELGADWLLTMQEEDGEMISYKRYTGKKWVHSTKYSLLYNGQVLSALSRIYEIIPKESYYNAAEKIAENFIQEVEKSGCYLGDDYRMRNPISSSWVVMSLLDFYKISKKEDYKELVFKCSNELVRRQISNPNDIFYHGRWQNAYTTSGNGWISEVMSEIYNFCKEENKDNCKKYKNAVIKASRWIIQNTYSEENSFFLPNPKRAIGGAFWNDKNKFVRTATVAHAVNGYLGIINEIEDDFSFSISEKPLQEIFNEFEKKK